MGIWGKTGALPIVPIPIYPSTHIRNSLFPLPYFLYPSSFILYPLSFFLAFHQVHTDGKNTVIARKTADISSRRRKRGTMKRSQVV